MNTYLLDTNCFIQAHRDTYPLDVAKSYWNKIKELADAGRIISIDKVRNEIYNYEDPLKAWCVQNLQGNFFHDSNTCINEYTNVVQWAMSRNTHFSRNAIDEFMAVDIADAWLVSYCLLNNFVLVTHETSDPTCKRRIKIPDACIPFGVHHMNPIQMFRALGEHF